MEIIVRDHNLEFLEDKIDLDIIELWGPLDSDYWGIKIIDDKLLNFLNFVFSKFLGSGKPALTFLFFIVHHSLFFFGL